MLVIQVKSLYNPLWGNCLFNLLWENCMEASLEINILLEEAQHRSTALIFGLKNYFVIA